MTRRRHSSVDVVELLQALGGALEPGTCSGELEAGDLMLEVQITVRRRLPAENLAVHKVAALQLLEREPYRGRRCSCHTQRKEWGRAGDCRNQPTHALIVESCIRNDGIFYVFVCSAHAKKGHGYPLARVHGVVEIPIGARDQLLAAWDAKCAEQRRACDNGQHVPDGRGGCQHCMADVPALIAGGV